MGIFYVAKDAVSILDFQARPNDSTFDNGPAIRQALASNKPVIIPAGTFFVGHDTASAFVDGSGNTRYSYSLNIPSNAVLICEGGLIKQMDGVEDWTRTVVIRNVSGVKIFGELRIDGNVQNAGPSTNEHMHGLFIFDSNNIYIERVDSQNSRGDNIFIGGTDENTVSSNIHIGSIKAINAGRKNLVLQQFDTIYIGEAFLDNSMGGASLYGGAPDTTDKHCLDVEPDSFTGATFHRAKIGSLVTKGAGFDFTAGITSASSEKCIIDIDSLNHIHTHASGVKAWIHYGVTVNVQNALFSNISGIAETFEVAYAARLNADHFSIIGSTPTINDPMMLVAQVSNNRPIVVINHLELTTNGIGVENRDGDVQINKYVPRTSGVVGWARGISSTAGIFTEFQIEAIDMDNVGSPAGAGYAFYLSKESGTSNTPRVRINHTSFDDNRSPDLNYIYLVGSGAASEFMLGTIDNSSAVTNVSWVHNDKFYRVAGGGSGPAVYICSGTPSGMISGMAGSMALRDGGGAGTSFYIKESSTGTTGWVAK